MNQTVRTAIDTHAAAIQMWTVTDVPGPAEVVASRVTTARLMSQQALSAYGAGTDRIREEVEAACRDAEAEAAIEAHARTIAELCRFPA